MTGYSSAISFRSVVLTSAYLSRLSATPDLTTAVDNEFATESLFLNPAFEAVHTGNNTVTGTQMTSNLST